MKVISIYPAAMFINNIVPISMLYGYRSVKLNRRKLRMLNNYLLPKMGGKLVAANDPIGLPPQSLGFFVVDAAIKACKNF